MRIIAHDSWPDEMVVFPFAGHSAQSALSGLDEFAGQLDILKICLHYFPGPSRPKLKLDPEAKAELAFNVFDKNHDGYVTKNEMLKVSKNLTKEQVIFAAISLGAVLK